MLSLQNSKEQVNSMTFKNGKKIELRKTLLSVTLKV